MNVLEPFAASYNNSFGNTKQLQCRRSGTFEIAYSGEASGKFQFPIPLPKDQNSPSPSPAETLDWAILT